MSAPLLKLGRFEDNEWVPYHHGNRFFRQGSTSEPCLVIGPSKGFVELLIELTQPTEGPWCVLYVLLIRACDRPVGRYQSSLFQSKQDLAHFLRSFQDFFEQDARHNVWVGSLKDKYTIVYERHQMIYCYGNEVPLRPVLDRHSFAEQEFSVSEAHCHPYHETFDSDLERLFLDDDWRHFPLVPRVDVMGSDE
jgi:hypothetical protein